MIRLLTILLFCTVRIAGIYATHNRAGEITYRHIGGYTYEFTITTYTYALSNAKRTELTISWGDGTESEVPILDPPGFYLIPGTDYFKNTYVARHTYSGAGIYQVLMEDPNRNQGVNNIPNSVNVIFSIKTTLFIGSSVGSNNTPSLLNPPIDKAARGHVFIHNPAAYDPDGDSISYVITTCTGAGGEPIDGYRIPAATDTLLINEVTGDLVWKTPPNEGVFNIAILVEEWRDGLRIGRIARDMQIDVYDTDNNPPVNTPIRDICVLAGDTVQWLFETTDADGDQLLQDLVGGPLVVTNPAEFIIDSSGYGWLHSHFMWYTTCQHARKQPYTLVLKSEDVTGDINLVDITSFSITVLHTPPVNVNTTASYDAITLNWTNSGCGTPVGYHVYRKPGSVTYNRLECETGVPEYTGYELITYIDGSSNTSYIDENNGLGLEPGFEYCYRITAVYADGAESVASEEVCAELEPGNPPILMVNVLSDDETQGDIEIVWAMPRGEDVVDDGPYRYQILRKAPGEEDFSAVFTQNASLDLNDTAYTDEDINTLVYPYTYSVILQYEEDGAWLNAPGNEEATSQHITIGASDNTLHLNMIKRTPWQNELYQVYRSSADTFNWVATSDSSSYIDYPLANNTEYTYYTIGEGKRPLYGSDYQVLNRSHLASGVPLDTISPCPVDIMVTSECDSVVGFNFITWDSPVDSCAEQDIISYIIYSRDSVEGALHPLDTVGANVFEYTDYPKTSIEQCYAVLAIDSANNKSVPIPYCVYNLCGLYSLPNVFTPNADGVNDNYVSWNFNGYIKQVNMKIYNRYGKELFRTQNADIEWDGKYDNKLVTTGVYFYICDVYEPRINGTIMTTLKGFIHVYSGSANQITE